MALTTVTIGSARHDENGTYTGGKAGDQTGTEVSTQNFYVHSKGWYGLRAKDATLANKIAEGMKIACANNNIGYNQNQRLQVVEKGIETTTKVNSDCSALVRAVLKWAGVTVGNFSTADEKTIILNTGKFDLATISSASDCYTGDILVTKTKGHTAIVISGKDRTETTTSTNPYTVPARTLKKGMTGKDVKWVQYELKESGFSLGKYGIDGEFGSTTETAVKKFQKKYKLTVDGIVGSKTLAKLKEV